jgi:cell division initiation protein
VNITPLDIRKQIFKKSFRGYDQEEVQAFLDMLATEVENLGAENIELKEHLNALQSEVHHYRSIEQALQEMLRTAQQTADEVKENGHKEARLIVKEAEIRSNRAIEKARTQVHDIRTEIVELQNQRDMFLSRFKALVQVQTDFLDQLKVATFDVVQEDIPETEDGATEQEGEDA